MEDDSRFLMVEPWLQFNSSAGEAEKYKGLKGMVLCLKLEKEISQYTPCNYKWKYTNLIMKSQFKKFFFNVLEFTL